jgi:hypothetical protein
MTKVEVEGTRKHTVTRVAYRFATGAHLDGQPRTDATAFRRGTKSLTKSGRTVRWSYLSRAERAAWRLGTLALLSSGGYGYAIAPTATADSVYAVGAAGSAYAARRAERARRMRKHTREWVRPLHLGLVQVLNLPPGVKPSDYLSVPIDYSTNDEAAITVKLPETFISDKVIRFNVESVIAEKLGMSDSVAQWHTAGRKPYMTMQVTPRPPKRVSFDDVLELVEKAPESSPIIGVGPRGVPVSVHLDTESPHILVSASTGGGKSVIVRALVSQLMHNGAHTIILDIKRHSHRWARSLDKVEYCRSIEEIHDALIRAGAEGERRNLIIDEFGEEATADLPRILIVCEEMNATINKLQTYWTNIRENTDPKRSPAVDALGEILFMGRAVKVNVIAVAQMMTARTLGGPEARECFAVRILARYTKNAWNMLVPEIQPMPRMNRHAGRAQVCIAGTAYETQVVFFSDKEALSWAKYGEKITYARGGGSASQTPSQTSGGQDVRDSAVSDTPTLTLVPEPPQLAGITLSEAVRDGVVSVSLDVLRKASVRDSEFPDPIDRRGNANLYDPAALMAWQRNRPRAVG